MQFRGPLMIEHRLIERLIALIRRRLETPGTTASVDPALVDAAADFLRFYADRTHHGKEEDILFAALEPKDMSAEDRRVMEELKADHVAGRALVRGLEEVNRRFRSGDPAAAKDVAAGLRKLVDLYPGHIEKEDRVFFPASERYFSPPEEDDLLARFREFDQKIIHQKYGDVVRRLEGGGAGGA